MKFKGIGLRQRFAYKFLVAHWKIVSFFLIILVVSLINTLHFFYTDEFDNILGGYFITRGRLPYVGFFTHHGPFAYIYSALIAIFSGPSFVKFRILLVVFNLSFIIAFIFYLKRRFGNFEFNLALVMLSILTVGATYWWGHMILADTLAGYIFLAVYAVLFFTIYRNENFRRSDLILLSVLNALILLTSLVYIYVVLFIYLFIFIWYMKFNKVKDFRKHRFYLGIFIAPYLVFLIYLVLTQSISDYIYQSITFNREFYAKAPDGSDIRNPIRHMVIVFSSFMDRYRAVLLGIKDFNLGTPLNSLMGISNLFMIVYLLMKRRFVLVAMLFLLMVYLNTRSNPFTTSETDYQAVPYIFFSLLNFLIVFKLMWDELGNKISDNKRLIYIPFLVLLIIFSFYTSFLLFNKGFEKAYTKYMGALPLIYDRPVIAEWINGMLTPEDYYYIGPFEFQEHLYMRAKLASKYFITIPAMDHSEKIKTELIDDLRRNRPKIIVFKIDNRIFGSYPGRFIFDFMKENYFTPDDLNYPTKTYNFKYASIGDYNEYDFGRNFFFDKNRKDEIINMLKEKGLIFPI